MQQEEVVLKLRNVTKKIGNRRIVDDLSFDVPAGEVFGFLGPNGAGKTTTIRMIVGLISMTQGEIAVKGISVRKQFELAMTHIGAIVENPEMYKFLTGYQNLVHFARRHSGVTKERIEEVIKLVGLQNRIHEKVKRYSLGMRQRLGVAQALLHRPSVLILDEPTNGLDPAGIRELRDYLRKLSREEGIAVIVSSHLLSEMELMCDRVAIIQAGKLIDVRSLQETADEAKPYKIAIDVNDPRRAYELVSASFQNANVSLQGNRLELVTDRARIPDIARLLVNAELDIYGIHATQKSLEDQFLEMTGGEMVV
ncbi:ABC transporter ATP-binding protein [Cohnella faecalis]|uniref:ABC transporter ATP-binding protein n=1 Tax=Cohnella faecalis TaxID=2315694 RepID=A0A398CFF3_9BACL|nr:ABC transporter ATP-binding protein [Cohnella faecalis]RIE01145.1 ABC transporter ATP-binding protein [Cohnella faecalis]